MAVSRIANLSHSQDARKRSVSGTAGYGAGSETRIGSAPAGCKSRRPAKLGQRRQSRGRVEGRCEGQREVAVGNEMLEAGEMYYLWKSKETHCKIWDTRFAKGRGTGVP